MRYWLLTPIMGFFLIASPLCAADPIEILAIGASQTNGRGVPPSAAYPAQLEALLRADGYDVVVKNAGIDGDKPSDIYFRMRYSEVNEHIKIVIFEQSANDASKSGAVEYSEKALAWLQDHHIPSIFISSGRVQPVEEARSLAKKYGAIYYGGLMKDIPKDNEHIQAGEFFINKSKLDYHLTSQGYGIIAKNMAPIVKKLIAEQHLGESEATTK